MTEFVVTGTSLVWFTGARDGCGRFSPPSGRRASVPKGSSRDRQLDYTADTCCMCLRAPADDGGSKRTLIGQVVLRGGRDARRRVRSSRTELSSATGATKTAQ